MSTIREVIDGTDRFDNAEEALQAIKDAWAHFDYLQILGVIEAKSVLHVRNLGKALRTIRPLLFPRPSRRTRLHRADGDAIMERALELSWIHYLEPDVYHLPSILLYEELIAEMMNRVEIVRDEPTAVEILADALQVV